MINYSISNLSSIKGNLILLFNISSYTIQFQNLLKSYFDKNTTTQFKPRTAAKRLSQQKSKRKTNQQQYFTELPDCLEKICHRSHCTISNNIVLKYHTECRKSADGLFECHIRPQHVYVITKQSTNC